MDASVQSEQGCVSSESSSGATSQSLQSPQSPHSPQSSESLPEPTSTSGWSSMISYVSGVYSKIVNKITPQVTKQPPAQKSHSGPKGIPNPKGDNTVKIGETFDIDQIDDCDAPLVSSSETSREMVSGLFDVPSVNNIHVSSVPRIEEVTSDQGVPLVTSVPMGCCAGSTHDDPVIVDVPIDAPVVIESHSLSSAQGNEKEKEIENHTECTSLRTQSNQLLESLLVQAIPVLKRVTHVPKKQKGSWEKYVKRAYRTRRFQPKKIKKQVNKN